MKRLLRYVIYRELYRAMRGTNKDTTDSEKANIRQTIDELDVERLPSAGESLESPEQVKAVLQQMDPFAFERLVADLWQRMGWTTEIPQRGPDEGVDVIAKKSIPYDQTTLIQAKRYGPNTTVGSPEIQQYASLKRQYDNVDKVVMVTTNTFTGQAVEMADRLNVKLVDGEDLVGLLSAYDGADIIDDHVPFVTLQAEDEQGVSEKEPSDGVATPSAPLERSTWYWGVVATIALWVAYLITVEPLGDTSMMVFGLPAWVMLPISLYLDARELDDSVDWPAHLWAYILIALIPVIAIISGLMYLLKRHQVSERATS